MSDLGGSRSVAGLREREEESEGKLSRSAAAFRGGLYRG